MIHKLFADDVIEYNPPITNHHLFRKGGITDYVVQRDSDDIKESIEPYVPTFYHKYYMVTNGIYHSMYVVATEKRYNLEGIQIIIDNP